MNAATASASNPAAPIPPEEPVHGLLATLDLLRITRAGPVLHLQLNRPAKRNALAGRDLYGMARRLKQLEREMERLRKQLNPTDTTSETP